MLDFVYHMTLKGVFGVQNSLFYHIYVTLLGPSLHNVTKSAYH